MAHRTPPSWDDYSINIAWVVSRRANCPRRSVGAFYTTLRPCFECFKLVVQAGVREIVYDRPLDFGQ